ncbi:MAG TPA: hypothetical protein GX701_00585 [Clostridiales bacterium]|nr:hypothetical protein [Clostridiales bacterium]
MGPVGALHKVYKERNNVTTYVFAYEIADNAFLFAVDPPAPHTTWDFRPIGLYYYHGKSDSVHFLGEYPLISVRVLNGANLAVLTTKATDIYQGGYAFPSLQYLTLERSGTLEQPVFKAKLAEEPFYAAISETEYYADAPYGERHLLSVQDAFAGELRGKRRGIENSRSIRQGLRFLRNETRIYGPNGLEIHMGQSCLHGGAGQYFGPRRL